MNDIDLDHLRRCIELAAGARATGNEPFGSLLTAGDGSVLLELANTTGDGDVTGHPELALAAWASKHLTPAERAAATLYTSCAMCATGQFWAGIGRLVFAVSGEQLASTLPPGVRALSLSSREVFARGNVDVAVEGPALELESEGLAVFEGFWGS